MESRHIQHMDPPQGSYESLAYRQLENNVLTTITARLDVPRSTDWQLQDLLWWDFPSLCDQVWL